MLRSLLKSQSDNMSSKHVSFKSPVAELRSITPMDQTGNSHSAPRTPSKRHNTNNNAVNNEEITSKRSTDLVEAIVEAEQSSEKPLATLYDDLAQVTTLMEDFLAGNIDVIRAANKPQQVYAIVEQQSNEMTQNVLRAPIVKFTKSKIEYSNWKEKVDFSKNC